MENKLLALLSLVNGVVFLLGIFVMLSKGFDLNLSLYLVAPLFFFGGGVMQFVETNKHSHKIGGKGK